jgi:DNA-binding transcriptional regulator YiaG
MKTVKEILEIVAEMPTEDLLEIQSGIAEMIVASFSPDEISEIRESLARAEAEFARGEGISSEEIWREFGIGPKGSNSS